ncbi:uncharacterized protein LOC133799763 [Humulus lupulus]|uniref:uncharacterized protein LOC133799763 n=1 Tax=Humulus lupulus TaxID=3486 RepID=UPI002B402CF4|nr:uncharacterized protein LOC133799763 [Humulus lupulus]
MDSVNVFDIYSTPETPTAPPSKKKASKRHPGESSKVPQAKKPRNAGLPEDGPSANTTPPSPRKQQTPPAPAGTTPPPAAPTDQAHQVSPASTGGDITSHAFISVKDRVAKNVKHDRCQEAMDVDLILNRTLNEFTNAMLTLTAGRLCSGAITEQAKSLEQRHADELKAAAEKYVKQLAVEFKEKNKLAEELKEKQKSLDKAIDQRDQFKESNRVNYRAAKQLEEDLAASRQENTTLEGWIEELEKANASNLERYNNATLRCFYDLWKHNQGANFNYLPENARNAELASCAARLEEEERARIPASPEISLAWDGQGRQ